MLQVSQLVPLLSLSFERSKANLTVRILRYEIEKGERSSLRAKSLIIVCMLVNPLIRKQGFIGAINASGQSDGPFTFTFFFTFLAHYCRHSFPRKKDDQGL